MTENLNIINKKFEIVQENIESLTHDNYGIHIIFYQHETDNKKKNIYLFTEKGLEGKRIDII